MLFVVFIASRAPTKAPIKVSLWFCDGYHDINAVKERGGYVSKSVYDTGMDWFRNITQPLVYRLKWFTEFGHLNRGDMLTSEQYRCTNEKKKF